MSELDLELSYLTFKKLRDDGCHARVLAAYFGAQHVAAMELRYESERAIDLINGVPRRPAIVHHDDAEGCGTCGHKHCTCRPIMGRIDRDTRMDR